MKLPAMFPPYLWLFALALANTALAKDDNPLLQPKDVFQLAYASSPIVDSAGKRVIYLRHTMDIMKDKRLTHLWQVGVNGKRHRPITSGATAVSHPALATDGNRVAYVTRDELGSQIFVHWLDQGLTAQLTRLPSAPKRLAWSPDGRWLAFTMIVHRDAPTMGTMPDKPKGAEWAPAPVVVERTVFRNDGRGNKPHGFEHVFVIPADGGSFRQLTTGDFHHSGTPAWSADSTALYLSANRNPNWALDPANTDIQEISLASGAIRGLTRRQGPDGDISVSPDGGHLAYTGWDDQAKGYHRSRLYFMKADGTGRRELLEKLDRSIVNPQWSQDSKRIFFQFDDHGDTVLAVTDLNGKMQRLASGLGGKSLGRPYSGADFHIGGGDVYAYTAGSATSPSEIRVAQAGKDRERQLTSLNDNLLKHRRLAAVEELTVRSSADGRQIQAWVARPPGFEAGKKYPLILEIHGGPFANYGPRFSAEVQLYAAAGYVVLYVNPRGSTSYGEEFGNLIHHAYPGQDYDDLMSAVDAAIAKGYVDEKQLYVTGGSGGGTLTAWIVGSTDRFRAAVVAKPVINWISFGLTADQTPYFNRYWFARMPWEDPMAYWRRSPLSLVGNVTTPTMLLTGESDLRTPMPETEQYYNALKLREIDTAMVRIPGASHSITRRPSQLIAKVAAILAWFERYRED